MGITEEPIEPGHIRCRDCEMPFKPLRNRKRCDFCYAQWIKAGKPADRDTGKSQPRAPKPPPPPGQPDGLLLDYQVVYKIGPKVDEKGREMPLRQAHKLAALTPAQKLLLEFMDSDYPKFMTQYLALEKDHRAAQRKAQEQSLASAPERDENEGRVEELIDRLLGEMEEKPWEKVA